MGNLSYSIVVTSFLVMVTAQQVWSQALTSDYGIDVTSADNLTFTGFEGFINSNSPAGVFNISFAFLEEYPALAGQGVSAALLKFGPKSTNALHSHPRASEIQFVLSGSILAGLIDTSNRLYTKQLYPGDAFLFPVGLTHFQVNYADEPATSFAAFGNPNPGRTSLPPNLFNSVPHLDLSVLESSFALDPKTIERLFTIPFPANG